METHDFNGGMAPEPMLFNLEKDISESADLFSVHPEVVKELMKMAKKAPGFEILSPGK